MKHFLIIILTTILTSASCQTFKMPSLRTNSDKVQSDISMPSSIAFDANNNPYVFNDRYIEQFGQIYRYYQELNKWDTLSYKEELINYLANNVKCKNCQKENFLPKIENHQSNGMISITDNNEMLLICFPANPKTKKEKRFPTVVYSRDISESNPVFEFAHLYDINENDDADVMIESNRGFNQIDKWLPVIGLWERTGKKLHEKLNFSHPNTFTVFFPDTTNGFNLKSKLILSDSALHRSTHSGSRSWAATVGDSTYVIYADLEKGDFDPNDLSKGQTSMKYAVIDRNTKSIVEGTNKFFAHAHKPKAKISKFPDGHCIPELAFDSKGNLHIIVGSHTADLHYYFATSDSKKLSIDDFVVSDKFGEKEVNNGASYPSLVVTNNDEPIVTYRRRWLESGLVFTKGSPITPNKKTKYFAEEKFLVVEPDESIIHFDSNPFDYYYTNWNHRLYVDNNGRIFSLNGLRRRDNECKPGTTTCEQNYPWILLYSDNNGNSWNKLEDIANWID